MPLEPAFVEELRARLLRVGWMRRLGAAREDVLQETIAIMSTVSPDKMVIPYALTVARNVARRMERQALQVAHEEFSELDVPDAAATAEEAAEAHETRDWLRHAWELLSERERRIIVLRLAEGREIAEVAEIMGLSRSAVFKAYSRAVRKLRFMVDL